MNTEVIVHPKLQHYGLTTAYLNIMIDCTARVFVDPEKMVAARKAGTSA